MKKDGVALLPTDSHWKNMQMKSTKFYNLRFKTIIFTVNNDDFNDDGGSAALFEVSSRASLFNSSLYPSLIRSVHQLYTSNCDKIENWEKLAFEETETDNNVQSTSI